MLSHLDECLWHQTSLPFELVATSDHRFFDRMWFAAYDPTGAAALQFTVGAYNNMNVIDGGFVVIAGDTQYNLRESRSLRPQFEMAVDAMRIDIIEPMKHVRLTVADGDHHVHGVLDWMAIMPPEIEKPHVVRVRGRLNEDYQRYDQVGLVNGELRVRGERLVVRDWWACRDHSWGVRPGVGGWDPVTGPATQPSTSGSLFGFLFFSTDTLAGHVQVAERGAERVYLTGLVRPLGDERDLHVDDATLRFRFFEGTRRMRHGSFDLQIGSDRLHIDVEALGRAIAMPGLGYSGGWNDGLALGAWRGDEYREVDVWNVAHPADVVREDGSVFCPMHRIQPVTVRSSGVGGDGRGTGSFTIIANGALPQYGLA